MKRFVLWAVVPALIALAEIAYCNQPFHIRYAPAIRVVLQDKIGGGVNYLPDVNGIVQAGSSITKQGTKGRYQVGETYSVISTARGHFAVVAHYAITRNGQLTEVDRMLPVWDKQPEQTQWLKLGNQLVAFAYLTGTQTGY